MCLTPFELKTKEARHTVPCGKCPDCMARRTSAWSFRLMQQEKISWTSYFITLTYDTNNVPITRNGFMGLQKRDLQLFFKRLRKSHPNNSVGKIKYFGVGEYGTKYRRPHYHVILFNSRIELIQPAWNKGEVHYGQVTGASVGYTLKYMQKPRWQPMHKNDDRSPQFQLMSKGLGANYLTPNMVRWHKADMVNRVYCNTMDGKKITMPRYYKDKIYNDVERNDIRQEWMVKMAEKEAENWTVDENGVMHLKDENLFFNRAMQAQGKFNKMVFKAMQSDKF